MYKTHVLQSVYHTTGDTFIHSHTASSAAATSYSTTAAAATAAPIIATVISNHAS